LLKYARATIPLPAREAASEWIDDGAMRMSAALAYYAVLSLAPQLIIGISIAGLVFSKETAQGQIAQQIQSLAGERTAEAVQALVKSAGERTTASAFATVVGVAFILFGASGVFGEAKTCQQPESQYLPPNKWWEFSDVEAARE
jgi:membrane protein